MSPALVQLGSTILGRLIDLAAQRGGLPVKIDVRALVDRREQLRLQRLARLEAARKRAGLTARRGGT